MKFFDIKWNDEVIAKCIDDDGILTVTIVLTLPDGEDVDISHTLDKSSSHYFLQAREENPGLANDCLGFYAETVRSSTCYFLNAALGLLEKSREDADLVIQGLETMNPKKIPPTS
jgi:hypothetical protein